jgi:glutathione S-transferase
MSTPKLWSWRLSPFAGKARVAFAEKGVEVDLIEIDPRNRPPRLRELNPTNRVPVLEIGDVAIRESTAICEWLEETHPEPALWPADPTVRAAARGMLRWVDDELTVNLFGSMRKAAFGPDSTDPPDIVTILRERLVARWSVAEALLGHTPGPWMMGGEEPTIVDLAAIPLAVRLPVLAEQLQPDPGECPATTAWLSALRERPSAAEVDHKGNPAPQ